MTHKENYENILVYLDNYREAREKIDRFIFLNKKRYIELFTEISSQSCFDDAVEMFDEIQVIQSQIALISFKYEYPLCDALNQFVKDFDRIDDVGSRKYWYGKLKSSGHQG